MVMPRSNICLLSNNSQSRNEVAGARADFFFTYWVPAIPAPFVVFFVYMQQGNQKLLITVILLCWKSKEKSMNWYLQQILLWRPLPYWKNTRIESQDLCAAEKYSNYHFQLQLLERRRNWRKWVWKPSFFLYWKSDPPFFSSQCCLVYKRDVRCLLKELAFSLTFRLN